MSSAVRLAALAAVRILAAWAGHRQPTAAAAAAGAAAWAPHCPLPTATCTRSPGTACRGPACTIPAPTCGGRRAQSRISTRPSPECSLGRCGDKCEAFAWSAFTIVFRGRVCDERWPLPGTSSCTKSIPEGMLTVGRCALIFYTPWFSSCLNFHFHISLLLLREARREDLALRAGGRIAGR